MDILDRLIKEWPTLRQVWLSFLLAVAACGVAIWVVLHFLFKKQLINAESRLALRDDEIAALGRLIGDLRPEKTAFGLLGNSELKKRTEKLVQRLRDSYVTECARAGRNQNALRWTTTYDSEFKSEAVLLRNEILQRLSHVNLPEVRGIWGPGEEYRIDLSMYGSIEHIVQIEALANHLESLCKLLPLLE